jgi:hypothetical protein
MMPVETFGNGGTVLTGDAIQAYRMMALYHALRLECKGLKRSRRPSALTMVKKEFGLSGGKWKVLEDYEMLLKRKGIFNKKAANG